MLKSREVVRLTGLAFCLCASVALFSGCDNGPKEGSLPPMGGSGGDAKGAKEDIQAKLINPNAKSPEEGKLKIPSKGQK